MSLIDVLLLQVQRARSPAEPAEHDVDATSPAPSVEDIYQEHADFVWSCLQRFGVPDGDLDDALQEVFVVVHRRLPSFRWEARMTTWLYAICLRVASGFRRRVGARRETVVESLPVDLAIAVDDPEGELIQRQRARTLSAVLDELPLERRALLVMFELDELSCEEIATLLDVPLGTVHSRLNAARKAFARAVSRYQARAARQGQ